MGTLQLKGVSARNTALNKGKNLNLKSSSFYQNIFLHFRLSVVLALHQLGQPYEQGSQMQGVSTYIVDIWVQQIRRQIKQPSLKAHHTTSTQS
ncbi:hypothetical protein N7447_005125 [Penicillium robsamsonii]|uniref:uncharacterized protein n=1 Tax=Penicillium robsamsonii TaxID=1792511 RepID=UPI0025476AB8|nr:uncharacterized protein N7447_005125 [Penicillium robsamsonii]KAJ5822785.1 hypothetical protein N7447_005125 [Penicillium robsamsonii]